MRGGEGRTVDGQERQKKKREEALSNFSLNSRKFLSNFSLISRSFSKLSN